MKKEKDACPICLGRGYIDIVEGDPEYEERKKLWGKHADAYIMTRRCECLLRRQFRAWVGAPIYNARIIEESALAGMDGKDLFITASRADFLAHFRRYLIDHEFTYFWRLTTDSDLRDIFVGNVPDYPSISSFTRDPDLVIIQLAVLSYKNVAMSGVVLEALRGRQFEGKPTWVVNPPDYPFREGHLAWSPELEYFMGESFHEVKIKNTQRIVSSGKLGFNDTLAAPQQDSRGNTSPAAGKRAGIQDNIDIL